MLTALANLRNAKKPQKMGVEPKIGVVYGKTPGYFEDGMMLILPYIGIPSRELTYPTLGKGKSSSKTP